MKKNLLLACAAVVLVVGTTWLVGNDETTAPQTPNLTAAPAAASTATNPSSPPVATAGAIPEAKTVPAPAKLSPGVEEMVQLARAQVGDEVLLAYVEASTNAFQLNAEEIIYLNDVGVSAEVVAAMVRHGQALREKELPLAEATVAGDPAPTDTAPAASGASEPAPGSAETAAAPAAANAAPPVTYNYFYNSLAPYGNWVQVENYGWCWQPTVAVVNTVWQPYSDNGRWVYTDSGWYWNSYYSWGWAPFHYGRWHNHARRGWVWMPGTVWGPAWVTWRYYNGYCGWAPLPPACGYVSGVGLTYHGARVGFTFGFGLGWNCYTYVPTTYFCHPYPARYRVHHSRGIHIHNNSTAVNNYSGGRNSKPIVNVGPGTRVIATATGTEVRRAMIKDGPPMREKPVRGDQLSSDGRTLAVYRPKVPNQTSAPPPEILRQQEQSGKQTDTLASSPAVRRAVDRAREASLAKPLPHGESGASPAPSSLSTTAPQSGRTPAKPGRVEGAPATKPGQPLVGKPVGSTSPNPSAAKPRTAPGSTASAPPQSQSQLKPTSPSSAARPAPRTEAPATKPQGPEKPAYEAPAPKPAPSVPTAPVQKPRSQASSSTYRPASPKPSSANPPVAYPQQPGASSVYQAPAPKPARAYAPAPSPVPAPKPAPSYTPAPSPVSAPKPAPNYTPAPPSQSPTRNGPSYSAPTPSYSAPAPSAPRSTPSAPRSAPSAPPSSFSKGGRG